jgi:hypothetical protein
LIYKQISTGGNKRLVQCPLKKSDTIINNKLTSHTPPKLETICVNDAEIDDLYFFQKVIEKVKRNKLQCFMIIWIQKDERE